MNEIELKAEVLDEIISYLDIMRENSQHHQDEYDAIQFLLNNKTETIWQLPFEITPLGDAE